MSDLKHFIRFGAIPVLGLLSLVVGFVILIFLLPQLNLSGADALVTTLIFLVIWLVVYISLIVGGIIVYVFKMAPQMGTKRKKSR